MLRNTRRQSMTETLLECYELGLADWQGPRNRTGLARLKGCVRKLGQADGPLWVILPLAVISWRNRAGGIKPFQALNFNELTGPEQAGLAFTRYILMTGREGANELVDVHDEWFSWFELALLFCNSLEETTLYRRKDGEYRGYLATSSKAKVSSSPQSWAAKIIALNAEMWPNILLLEGQEIKKGDEGWNANHSRNILVVFISR